MKPCPYCGTTMQNPRRVQCGAPECKRQWQNQRMRTYLHAQRRAAGVDPQPFDCAHCGEHCIPGDNVAPHASRFCGATCKRDWHSAEACAVAHAEVVERKQRKMYDEWVAELLAPPRRMQVAAYQRHMRSDPCSYCGGPAEALDHIEPKAQGGSDGWENRTATCRQCNSQKGRISLLPALLFIPAAHEYHTLRRVLCA